MKRLPLILLMLLPVLARAQEVKPGLSKAYLDLIRKDSARKSAVTRDTTNSIRNSFYSNTTRYDGHYPIGKIKLSNKNFSIKPVVRKSLLIATTFNSSFELRPVNRQAALQNEFAQGRSQNGQLIWHGPETNELFSYGPSMHALEFDNSNYAYDINGRLVPAGTGSGKKAIAYDNDILRTGTMLSHSLNIQAKYRINVIPRLVVGLLLSDKQERLPVKENKNSGQHLNASIALPLRTITIKGTYTTLRDRYTHPNRNGFLNRIYQQSLLTPASFDNKQGSTLGASQRSYSSLGDNPYFLLNTDENSYDQSNQTATLSLEKRIRSIKLELQHSIEDLHQRNNETYRPGTAQFPAGAAINRRKDDNNYQLKAGIEFNVPYSRGDLSSTVDLNYMYGNNRSAIRYQPGQQYHYQRSYHDMIFNYISMLTKRNFEGGLTLTNKLYASNSSNKKDFFLPGISLLGKFHEPFNLRDARVKIVGAFNNFNSELPISRSFSSNNLLQYTSYQSLQYFPVTEVTSFDRLDPIQHKEWNFRLEADYKYTIYLEADYYIRNTRNDVFAVYRSGGLALENIADHRNQGYEIDLNFTSRLWNAKKVTTLTTIGLFRNKSTVTDVKNGYNGTPIAGFSNIYKTVIKGQPLGAITGTRFKRDAANKLIIGGDGFPLADATPAVIGNPIPDFVLKFGHNMTWKAFTLGCTFEWKKGGEMWNGTQAVLDYYGRSANSAQLRNTSNYIFDGVLENGHANNIPVDFYNPALPVESNRWTRYGYTGVDEEYIRKADYLRLNNLSISYRVKAKKILQQATFTLSASNIIIWTPYDGADPNQLLFDQQQTTGLDFFNLPSTKNFGFSVSLQF